MFKPPGFRIVLSRSHRPLRAYSRLAWPTADANVQRVRIRKPLFSARRAKTLFLYTATIYVWWNYALPMLEGDEDEEAGANTAAQESKRKAVNPNYSKQDDGSSQPTRQEGQAAEDSGGGEEGHEDEEVGADEDDEDAIFIPLGWAKKLPKTFYKGTDPEWQEFRKFAQDRRRGERVRHELAGLVGSIVSKQPHLVRQLGKDFKIGKYWLDIDFPDGPPPEYERSGLIITEDYIAWGKRPVSQRNYSRLRQALYPYPIFSSFYATYKAIFALQIQKARQLLGLSQKSDEGSNEAAFNQKIQDLQRTRHKLEGLQSQKENNGQTSAANPAKPLSGISPSASETGRKDSGWLGITGSAGQSKDMASVFSVFARTLGRSWRPVSGPPPRGSLVVSGLVEITGSRAMCVMDVSGAYDPRLNKFVGLGMRVRRFQLRVQSPKGGI